MATWAQISKQLEDTERQIAAEARQAKDKVRKEGVRLAQVNEKRQELLDAHRHTVATSRAEKEMSLQTIEAKAQEDIDGAVAARKHALERSQLALERAGAASERAFMLDKEVTRLYTLVAQCMADRDAKRQDLVRSAEHDIRQKKQETDKNVRDLSAFACEMQEDAFVSIETMQKNVRASSSCAGGLSSSRSRFEKLYNVAISRATEAMSEQTYQTEREKLIGEWYGSWATHVDALVPGPPCLAQETVLRPTTPMTPRSENRPRSVDLARQRALQSAQLFISNRQSGESLPPLVELDGTTGRSLQAAPPQARLVERLDNLVERLDLDSGGRPRTAP